MEGRLRITDRKKDLIKTSGGKYIAPQSIEMLFKARCPLASQMVVHAEGRNYATALVTLDPEAPTQWAGARGLSVTAYAELTALPAVCDYVQTSVDQMNSRLNRWETIKDFRILDRDLTVENGEVTPSMKVRRKVVDDAYRPCSTPCTTPRRNWRSMLSRRMVRLCLTAATGLDPRRQGAEAPAARMAEGQPVTSGRPLIPSRA